VDLCFKIREIGLRLIYTPFTVLSHLGHATLSRLEELSERSHSAKADMYLLRRWGGYLSYDPYFPERMRDLLYKDSPTPYRLYANNQENPTTSKADILCVSHDMSLSGAPIICFALAKRLQLSGYFNVVISPMDGELRAQIRESSVPVMIDPLIFQAPDTLGVLFRDFDIVLAHTILSWRTVLAGKAMGKKVLWVIHEGKAGEDLAQANESIQLALSLADKVIFPAGQTRQRYQRFAKTDNQVVVHNGIEEPRPSMRRDGSEKRSALKVVHVGSVEPRKGQDMLLRAVSRLADECQQWFEFHLIGRTLDVDYEAQVRANGRALKNVNWLGPLSRSEVLDHIADCDVFVCTSRDEVLPLVVIEAMALGRAIISTRVGGIPEIITEGVDGIIVGIDDDRALADKLVLLHNDQSLLSRLGSASRNKYEAELTMERYGREMLRLVEELQ
jgi:O-antigen biosynthesis protein